MKPTETSRVSIGMAQEIGKGKGPFNKQQDSGGVWRWRPGERVIEYRKKRGSYTETAICGAVILDGVTTYWHDEFFSPELNRPIPKADGGTASGLGATMIIQAHPYNAQTLFSAFETAN